MKLFSVCFVMSFLIVGLSIAETPVRWPIGTIGMRTEPRGAAWPLACIDGTPYFLVGRPRQPHDKPTGWPGKSGEQCTHFEMLSIDGETTLKNLGAGGFSLTTDNFVPKLDLPEADRPPTGYLTADYSVTPPVVKLGNEAGKFATWKVTRGDAKDDWYIENIGHAEKHAWLSLEDKATALVSVGYDGKNVSEFRRAVISFSVKHVFRISVENDER
jgi:hypothetical protein